MELIRKNILLFADKLPPQYGGMESHAEYFIKHFSNHKEFCLRAIVTKDSQMDDLLIEDDSCTKVVLENYLKTINWKVDIVFFNSGRWIEELHVIRSILPSSLLAYRTGGNEILKADLVRNKIVIHADRQLFWRNQINENIDILITNSDYTENRLSGLRLHTSLFKKCVGGVDTEYIKRLNRKPSNENKIPVFFCASRFVHYKNHNLLIDTFKKLNDQGYKFALILAGDGPLLEEVIALVQETKLNKQVSFTGPMTNHQVLLQMLSADFYIQLSSEFLVTVEGGSYIHSEGMGRSILEAISLGLFVITASTGALPEIVSPNRGVLVNIDSPMDVFEKIKNAIGNRKPKSTISEKYSWDRYFSQYEKLFIK